MQLIRFGAHASAWTLLLSLVCATVCGAAQQPDEASVDQVDDTAIIGRVRGTGEQGDGPVTGYRATRSNTFTKTDTSLKDVPATVNVVPKQLIRDMAIDSLAEVFRYVPGTMWHQGEGNRDQVVIRGNSTSADFYVDGIRDDAQVFRDLYNLERVEVLQGPAGMAFGRGGAGGIVNRVTKKPVFDRIADATLLYGSYNQYRGTLDVGNKIGDNLAFRVNGVDETANSFRTGYLMNRLAINPTVAFRLDPATVLTVGYEHLYDKRTADRGDPSFNGAPYVTDPSLFFGNAAQSHAYSNVDSTYAVLAHDFGGGLRLRNSARYTFYNKYYENVFAGSAVTAANTLTLSAYNNANRRGNFFNQSDVTKSLTAGSVVHTILAGIELGTQDSINRRNTGFFGAAGTLAAPVVSALNPFAVATAFRQNTTDANNEVYANVLGIYVQDQIALSKRWQILVGLRYDTFGVFFNDRRTLVPAIALSRTDKGLSPRAALIYAPNAAQSYYISYSSAVLPSGEQLSLVPTTDDLSPEYAKNYEIGGRWDVAPSLTLSAAVFRTDRTNVKVADPSNIGFFLKTGQQRTDGFEIGAQGNVNRAWSIYGGYAYLNGRVITPVNSGTASTLASIVPAGTRLPLVPKNTFALWNKVDGGTGVAGAVGVTYQSSYFTSINNLVNVPGFALVDAAVYYTFANRKTRLSLNMDNIMNVRYFPTADGDNNITVGTPRSVRLSLSTGI